MIHKREIIDLADTIRKYQEDHYRLGHHEISEPYLIDVMADFCARHNPLFKRGLFLAYIRGECGPNGGQIT